MILLQIVHIIIMKMSKCCEKFETYIQTIWWAEFQKFKHLKYLKISSFQETQPNLIHKYDQAGAGKLVYYMLRVIET